MKALLILLLLPSMAWAQLWKQSNFSPSYEQIDSAYTSLEESDDRLSIHEFGETDFGLPLKVAVLTPVNWDESSGLTFFINNAIHPGEPCGVNASGWFVQDWLKEKSNPSNVRVAVVFAYNVGGMHRRDCCSRANQNGPEQHGFRGNAKNLDLNRDYIKNDSRNASAFKSAFHSLDVDVFLDTHTSNGADYQYTMTIIPTQPDKLSAPMGDYLRNEFMPALYSDMEKRGWQMAPYVNVYGNRTPEEGYAGFMDSPRYSTGYTALYHVFGFTSEAHMWKPFDDRVESTVELIRSIYSYSVNHAKEITDKRAAAIRDYAKGGEVAIDWALDSTHFDELSFMGFEASRFKSEVTGELRLMYDRSKPYVKIIPHYDYYTPSKVAELPSFYIVQGSVGLEDHLASNLIEYQVLLRDTLLQVEVSTVTNYRTVEQPYEGHYLHYDVEVEREVEDVFFRRGTLMIPTDQEHTRVLVETLELEAPDSYFAWNFFDSFLQQKEYFSPYIFEDYALQWLVEHPEMRNDFIKETEGWDAYSKLNWIYQRCPMYEHPMRMPVFKAY